jgi:homoserine dehydrogenase
LTILSRLVPNTPVLPEGYASIPTQSLVPPALSDAKTKEEYLSRKECMVVRYVGVVDVKEGKVEAKLGK